MPELTPRLGIEKPTGNEHANRQSINRNWDIIDEKVETIQGSQNNMINALASANVYTDQKTGDLSNLSTSNKTNLVNAINELFQHGVDIKSMLVAQLNAMNRPATTNESLDDLLAKITDISKDANATPAQVLSPNTFYQGGQKRAGTMPNRGNVNQTLTSQNQSYTVPGGYHGGSGTVRANISNLSAGNIRSGANVGGVSGSFSQYSNGATAAQILTGRSAAVNGSTVNGSMPNRSGNVNAQSRSRSGTTLRLRPPEGYYNGNTSNSVQSSDSNWVASNIRSGVSIFGLTGSLRAWNGEVRTASGNAEIINGRITVTGLAFRPRAIITMNQSRAEFTEQSMASVYFPRGGFPGVSLGGGLNVALNNSGNAVSGEAEITSNGFSIRAYDSSTMNHHRWIAFE